MEILIALHNIMRWVIVILFILALVRAYRGWLGKRDWDDPDRKTGVFLGAAMDTQLLLGIILWIFGNWGIKAFDLPSADGANRMAVLFFALEHTFTMIVAVTLVHIGTVKSRKAETAVNKHKWAAVFFTIAILLVLLAVPWTQRPLLPGV